MQLSFSVEYTFMRSLFAILIAVQMLFSLGASAQTRSSSAQNTGNQEERRDYQIPLPTGGFRMGTQSEYLAYLQQEQQRQQRQRVQNQIAQQLQQISGGGAGGGAGGGSGSGGGQKSSSQSNNMKPLTAADFGAIPDFSKGNKELEKLVAESSKPDSESQRLLEQLKKQIDEANSKQPDDSSNLQIPDFSSMVRDTLSTIQKMAPYLNNQSLLLANAKLNDRRRVVFRGPLRAPSERSLVVGRSAPRAVNGGPGSGVIRPTRILSSIGGDTPIRFPESRDRHQR